MTSLKRLIRLWVIVIAGLFLTAVLVLMAAMNALAIEPTSAVMPGDGFLLRFDPDTTQFEVITLPTVAGRPRRPHSLATVPNLTNDEIWYTDPGANRIGRLTYTATNDYAFREFDLPAESDPFDLVANIDYIWFTARKGNSIRRLERSTAISVSFPISTPNSAPWSITIGSGDRVWFTEKEAGKLGRLIVTATNDFALTEYTIPEANAEPQGIVVAPGTTPEQDLIFFSDTAPNQSRLARLKIALPANNFVTVIPLAEPSYPVNLARKGNDIWFTELLGNNIWEFHRGTLLIIRTYPIPTPGSQPYDLLVGPNGHIWFSERLGRNLGRLTAAGQFSEYPVPSHLATIWLQGVGLDARNKIWVAGFVPESVYLPTIFKES